MRNRFQAARFPNKSSSPEVLATLGFEQNPTSKQQPASEPETSTQQPKGKPRTGKIEPAWPLTTK
jgi:hypothetical protein